MEDLVTLLVALAFGGLVAFAHVMVIRWKSKRITGLEEFQKKQITGLEEFQKKTERVTWAMAWELHVLIKATTHLSWKELETLTERCHAQAIEVMGKIEEDHKDLRMDRVELELELAELLDCPKP